MKIISVGVCLEALILIKNLHHPSGTNRIDNYVRWLVVGFEILTKSKKIKKCLKITVGKAMKMKIGLKMTLKRPYLGQKI